MKKRLMRLVCWILIGCFLSVATAGCYGRFALTRMIYRVNGSIGDKWVNSICTWIFLIIPVYEVCGLVDFVLLNVIQFWTGRNPIAMGPDERDTQLAFYDNRVVEITATQNRFDVKTYDDFGNSRTAGMVYDPATQTWFAESPGAGKIRMAQADPRHENRWLLFGPDGGVMAVD